MKERIVLNGSKGSRGAGFDQIPVSKKDIYLTVLAGSYWQELSSFLCFVRKAAHVSRN